MKYGTIFLASLSIVWVTSIFAPIAANAVKVWEKAESDKIMVERMKVFVEYCKGGSGSFDDWTITCK